jgi:hypothetical protein
MTPEMKALGARAVACKGWKWMEGMLTSHSARLFDTVSNLGDGWLNTDELPDLSDPATMGCLLALVREAWGSETHTAPVYLGDVHTGWAVWIDIDLSRWFEGTTEAAALVAALEAAP